MWKTACVRAGISIPTFLHFLALEDITFIIIIPWETQLCSKIFILTFLDPFLRKFLYVYISLPSQLPTPYNWCKFIKESNKIISSLTSSLKLNYYCITHQLYSYPKIATIFTSFQTTIKYKYPIASNINLLSKQLSVESVTKDKYPWSTHR